MAAPAGARVVAWAGFVFGSVMSIAGNFLHAWLPDPSHGSDWTPPVAAQVGAAVWPIALLISVEVLSRVQWPDTMAWNLARYGGAGTVAIGSGVISYGHLYDVLIAWNYGELGAHVGPLVLDGLMVVSGFALLAQAGADRSDHADRTTPAAEPDQPVRVHATAERTTPDQPVRTAPEPPVRPALLPVSDRLDRGSTTGPDPLLDEAVRWSADLAGPPSQRAVRERFKVGRDRAARLLGQLQEASG